MKKSNWRAALIISLIVVSGLSYCLQILIFNRTTDTFFYMLQDFAFVPIQVLLVTLVINELMARREKSQLQHKMNMVIGAFFLELGNELLMTFAGLDACVTELRKHLRISLDWTDRDFAAARRTAREHKCSISGGPEALRDLRSLLCGRRDTLLRLLENPNLLEHESFTELLWAVSHLAEELDYRTVLDELPASDLTHLEGDAQRAYRALVSEWLAYVGHLRDQYPYMFSLILRTNPFDPEAVVTVK